MKKIFLKFNKFVFTNITGTIVETFILWLLSNFIFGTYIGKYIIAPTISFEFAVLNNYSFSYFWIWRERVQKRPKDFFRKFLFYNINCAITFLLRLGLIILIERIFRLHVVYCNLIALAFSGRLNYFIQDKLIFRKKNLQEQYLDESIS